VVIQASRNISLDRREIRKDSPNEVNWPMALSVQPEPGYLKALANRQTVILRLQIKRT
jgi:hypothetical protein